MVCFDPGHIAFDAACVLTILCTDKFWHPHRHTGGYHELLLGPEKDEVIGAVRDWVLARSGSSTPVSAKL